MLGAECFIAFPLQSHLSPEDAASAVSRLDAAIWRPVKMGLPVRPLGSVEER
jgi:hypothetical protein